MTPEQEERVRLALAAAARAEDEARPASAGAPAHPMPPDVAARLDDVLAELVEGRGGGSASPAPSSTDELAARRRKKRWPQVLVAAAAVAVIAAAGGVVANGGLGTSGGASDSAASSSSDQQAPEALAGGGDASGSSGSSGGKAAPSPVPSPAEGFVAGAVPDLHRDTLGSDVRSALGRYRAAARAPQDSTRRRADGARCAAPTAPRGADVVDVHLDGRPATLVALAPEAGVREARVYSCDDGDHPVAVVEVPAR